MKQQYAYPLKAQFKLATLGNRFTLTDSQGTTIAFIKQKMFKLRESIQVYSDTSQQNLLGTISTDKIIDWSAAYTLSDSSGAKIGSVRRHGSRSLLKASYSVFNSQDQHTFEVTELNPWTKLFDALFSELPVIGLLSGYLFNPSYAINTPDGQRALTVTKQASFLESSYKVDQDTAFSQANQELLLYGLTVLILLERMRG